MQLFNNFIIFRVVLETAPGINRTGEAKPVQLTHKLARRIDLQLQRQLRPFRQGRIENHRVRFGDQHPGGVTAAIAHDFTAGRIRRLFGVTHRLQRRTVQQRAIVEMEDKYRRIRRRRVQLLEGGHAPFGELKFTPAADNAHPLRRRRAIGLIFQHAQRVRQRRNPSQRSSRL